MTAEERLKQLQDLVIDLRQGKHDHILKHNYQNWTLKFKSYNPEYMLAWRREYAREYYKENLASILNRHHFIKSYKVRKEKSNDHDKNKTGISGRKHDQHQTGEAEDN